MVASYCFIMKALLVFVANLTLDITKIKHKKENMSITYRLACLLLY